MLGLLIIILHAVSELGVRDYHKLRTFREEELFRMNLQLLLFPAVKLTENSRRYEACLLMVTACLAVRTDVQVFL